MDELASLHHDLLTAINHLEALTLRATCDEAAVTAVRYRLTRLSSTRRKLVQALCERLREEGSKDAAVLALLAQGAASRATSSAHISSWTLRRVVSEWEGYRQASAAMRAAMRRQIKAEAAALYPYLRDSQPEGVQRGAAADPASRPPSTVNSAPVI